MPLASHPTLKRILKAAVVKVVRYFPHKKRQEIFDESIRNKLIESKAYFKTYEELKNNPPEYDVYLTGSDQVFNAGISPQALPVRLLSFVQKGVKASYAASAGSSKIQRAYDDTVRDALARFDHLSVREKGLADYLESSYQLHAEHHVDPVFLLDKDEWIAFSKKIDYLPKEYILYYKVLPQKELNALTERISKELGLPIFVADGHDRFSKMIDRSHFLAQKSGYMPSIMHPMLSQILSMALLLQLFLIRGKYSNSSSRRRGDTHIASKLRFRSFDWLQRSNAK